ncbi:F-box/LRR-repeat protein 2 [Diachasma alloeum]|uniref:F-box/LRR-repeat protein 2 n=1 Tax=Diachasma alloeum TaxID=454923 RepID=UPI0007384CC7|nr:F-box/LRR-repeat protein 2 [Diachasma alloeum]XP_015109463.1 F-box/LRR-repeat protein 2 [Diachasma alloeum]
MATSGYGAELSPGMSGGSEDVDFINRLDNVCLMTIFLYLPPGDKLTAEKVCKRWRAVSKLAWSNVTHLDLTKFTAGPTDFDKLPDIYKNIQSVARTLKRCGRYLCRLKLGSPCHYTMIPFVARHCENLIRLEISLCQNGNHISNVQKITSLEYFCLEQMMNDSGSDVLGVLPCENLRELYLHASEFGYEFESTQRPKLPYGYDHYLRDLMNLSVMSLHYFDVRGPMEDIINQNSKLTSLTLKDCVLTNLNFSGLANLEYLDLESAINVDDNLLDLLAKNCKKLKYLNLDCCDHISDEGLTYLWQLPQLEDLSVNHIYGITDFTFSGLHNLRKLSCEDCECVQSNELITFLRIVPNLEYLNLKWTRITHQVLIEANAVTKRRANGIPLRLLVGSSVTADWGESPDSPLLIVESTDDTVYYPYSRRSPRFCNEHDNFDPDYQFEYEHGSDSESDDRLDRDAPDTSNSDD